MTVRLIVFLMLVVPLQLAWGAVSAYCEHETEAVSDHVGHHVHKHQQDEPNQAVEPGDDTKNRSFDFDCGACHAAGGIALCSGIAALSFNGLSFAFTPAPSFHITLFSSKPERPKWSGLA
jgi:hypothetical protein